MPTELEGTIWPSLVIEEASMMAQSMSPKNPAVIWLCRRDR
jgi:hypothetical protein